MTNEHIKACARVLASGQFGGFACTIGEALLLADSHNFERVAAAFPDLIQKAAEHIAYEEARIACDYETCQNCGEITHLSGLIGENANGCPKCGRTILGA